MGEVDQQLWQFGIAACVELTVISHVGDLSFCRLIFIGGIFRLIFTSEPFLLPGSWLCVAACSYSPASVFVFSFKYVYFPLEIRKTET